MNYYTLRKFLILAVFTIIVSLSNSNPIPTLNIHKRALAAGQCQADARGNYQVVPNDCCTLPNGGVLSDCPTGTIPRIGRINPNNCRCVNVNDRVVEFFNILNGIMIPITILMGVTSIMLNGYKILTSQGNPQELQAGKEGITSAIIGLLFSLMAVSILRVIIKSTITGDVDPFG